MMIPEIDQITKRELLQENKRLRHQVAELEAQVQDLKHRLAQFGLVIHQQGGLKGSEVK